MRTTSSVQHLTTAGGKLVIGSNSDNGLAGSVYVYNGTTGQVLFQLQNPSPGTPNRFGCSLAAFGNDILVGARGEENQVGRVYLFSGSTGQLLRTFEDPAQSTGFFGFSVAQAGANILVSAPVRNGMVYLINPTTGQTVLSIANPAPGDRTYFGQSVTFLGGDIVVGTPSGPDPGTVYVYDGTTGALLHTLANPQTDTGASGFGQALAVFGHDLIATAASNDPGGVQDAGAAYLIDGATWTIHQALPNPDPHPGDLFGVSAAVVDGTFISGAIMTNVGGVAQAGVVYLFPLDQPPTANNDAFRVKKNHALTVVGPGVLANDTDPDSATLTAVLVTGPAHGTLTLNKDGSFTYRPVKGFTGTDTFTYKASDGMLDSNTASVTITVFKGDDDKDDDPGEKDDKDGPFGSHGNKDD